jgi:hypothetical protein
MRAARSTYDSIADARMAAARSLGFAGVPFAAPAPPPVAFAATLPDDAVAGAPTTETPSTDAAPVDAGAENAARERLRSILGDIAADPDALF